MNQSIRCHTCVFHALRTVTVEYASRTDKSSDHKSRHKNYGRALPVHKREASTSRAVQPALNLCAVLKRLLVLLVLLTHAHVLQSMLDLPRAKGNGHRHGQGDVRPCKSFALLFKSRLACWSSRASTAKCHGVDVNTYQSPTSFSLDPEAATSPQTISPESVLLLCCSVASAVATGMACSKNRQSRP